MLYTASAKLQGCKAALVSGASFKWLWNAAAHRLYQSPVIGRLHQAMNASSMTATALRRLAVRHALWTVIDECRRARHAIISCRWLLMFASYMLACVCWTWSCMQSYIPHCDVLHGLAREDFESKPFATSMHSCTSSADMASDDPSRKTITPDGSTSIPYRWTVSTSWILYSSRGVTIEACTVRLVNKTSRSLNTPGCVRMPTSTSAQTI